MEASRNASIEQARQQSLALLNQHLAAAVILRDRMQRSPRNLRGVNFIMIDDMCDRVACLMEACMMLIADRLNDLGGTVHWPVLLDRVDLEQTVRRSSFAVQMVSGLSGAAPLDAFGPSVPDAVTVATACGDTTTAVVMESIWRDVDQPLWKAAVQMDHRQ